MTINATGTTNTASQTDLALTLRLVTRELRGGLKGFYIFIACIALGVAAITGVGSLANALSNGIAKQGQILLGGDLEFSRIHQRATSQEKQALANHGTLNEIATMRAMARNGNTAQTLVEIKAVDLKYPLYGTLKTENKIPAHSITDTGNVIADPILLQRLNLKVGDNLQLASTKLKIIATIADEPDRLSTRNVFGPRLLMSLQTLKQTGLIQPGSLIPLAL